MTKKSKRYKGNLQTIDSKRVYPVLDAIQTLKTMESAKFDESIEVAMVLGVDPAKSDQSVRGTVSLPHGTGKKVRVVAICEGDDEVKATNAGAIESGSGDLVEKIKAGWLEFDAVVASPQMMKKIAPLARILGPRGLMPSPKSGTVTKDVEKAVSELIAGRLEFRVDKFRGLSVLFGKKSFSVEQLNENFEALLSSIKKLKPASSKGAYIRSMYVSTTMSPALKVEC